MTKDILFNEADLLLIGDALRQKIKTTTWNLEDETEWEALKALKFLEYRIVRHLDEKE